MRGKFCPIGFVTYLDSVHEYKTGPETRYVAGDF